jgi:CRP/FNR family cyclic AMP-dependent transcriptional regulator
VDQISTRLARALLRFSGRLGHDAEGGGRQMMPITHELLGQYIGTSREVVAQYMSQFRQQGYLSYSRKCILVYPEKMKTLLANEEKGAV